MANCNWNRGLNQFFNNYKKKMHTHTNMHNAMCVYLSWAYYELNQSKDLLTSKHVGNKEK